MVLKLLLDNKGKKWVEVISIERGKKVKKLYEVKGAKNLSIDRLKYWALKTFSKKRKRKAAKKSESRSESKSESKIGSSEASKYERTAEDDARADRRKHELLLAKLIADTPKKDVPTTEEKRQNLPAIEAKERKHKADEDEFLVINDQLSVPYKDKEALRKFLNSGLSHVDRSIKNQEKKHEIKVEEIKVEKEKEKEKIKAEKEKEKEELRAQKDREGLLAKAQSEWNLSILDLSKDPISGSKTTISRDKLVQLAKDEKVQPYKLGKDGRPGTTPRTKAELVTDLLAKENTTVVKLVTEIFNARKKKSGLDIFPPGNFSGKGLAREFYINVAKKPGGIEQIGKGGNDDALDTNQINEIMQDYRKVGFLGAIPRDYLAKINPGNNVWSCVLNTDKSSEEGQHWLAIYCDPLTDKSIEYYDSFADKCPEDIQKELKKIVDRMSTPELLKFKTSSVVNQDVNSSNCGYFACRFLQERYAGVPFWRATGYVPDKKIKRSEKGEKEVEDWKKKKFQYI